MYTSTLLATVGLSCLALAQDGKLDKPPLHDNLDYLKEGLAQHLPVSKSTNTQWAGFIPEGCQSITQDRKLDPKDVVAYNVTYDDCTAPWVLCHHKDSPTPVSDMIDLWGQVPVHMRQSVRHLIALPNPSGGWAYNSNGNIVLFGKIDGAITVFIHETAHSLDHLGGLDALNPFSDQYFHASDTWLKNYALDSNVPDPYAQSSQAENLAQNTVVSVFNENVPGGFGTVQQDTDKIFNQQNALQTAADNAPSGHIFMPGGQCTHRLENSAPVANSGSTSSRIKGRDQSASMPDVSLPSNLIVIPPQEFDTKEHCKHTW